MKLRTSVLAVAALSCAGTAVAQTSVDDEIVVYGARLAQPETEMGSSVGIITSDEIEALGFDYALDAIAAVPGVTINQNGAFGGTASVRIRGASSGQTLVIIDGIVVNDPTSPGGGFDFSRLDPANIDRIEVLKGPQSTLWGTDAIGGVINIVTKRPSEGMTGSAFAQAGSYSSVRAGAEIGYATERFDVRLSAIGNNTDGISKADERNGNTEDDGYESQTLNLTSGVNLNNDVRLEATVLWSDADTEFDSFVFGNQGNVGDGDELNTTEQLVGNVALRASYLDGRFENLLQYGYSDIDRRNFSSGAPSNSSEGDRTHLRYQGTFDINESNRIAFGAEREDSDSNGEEVSISGLYALYELRPNDSWTLSAGLRQDDHDRFDSETTARVAAAYNPSEQWTLRASWGEGFKAPTILQSTYICGFCGLTEPNTNLRPEQSDAWDAGVTFRTADSRGEFGVTYFDQDITDQIDFSFTAGYDNIESVRSKGFEIDAAYRFAEWLDVFLSYANIDAKDGTGTRLIRVPRHSGDLRFTFNPQGRFSGTLLTRYNGEEQDPSGAVDSWTRIDLSGSYNLNESVELYARIENLLDEEYQQIVGYGTPGVSGYFGARLRF